MKFFSSAILLALLFIGQSFITDHNYSEDSLEWKILGITTVKENIDRDEVKVGAKKGTFSAIKIKVKAAPLEMGELKIHFGNGEVQKVHLRKNFDKNTESRIIDLKGDRRIIKNVVFWYKKKKKSGPMPAVVLLGLGHK